MKQSLADALASVRSALLDEARLVRAIGSGRQRGRETPRWRRVELRYVDLKAGGHLQVTAYDDTQAHTTNHPVGEPAADAVDALLAEPFGNWHLDSSDETRQVRVTKRLDAVVHTAARSTGAAVPGRVHDRAKERLLREDDPVLVELGISDHTGRLKPSRQAKYRQVEEFVRILDATLTEAIEKGRLRTPSADDPLRIVDLGCGNAYLTLAAHRFLTSVRGLPVVLTGVDVKDQSREHNSSVADRLGIRAEFVVGSIDGAEVSPAPEVVLALHACDTATDEALARAVGWRSAVVLAAPCCHHDIAAQLRAAATPAPYSELTRHGILRERLADTLTDALRASLMRGEGYRVDVMQFVESRHTPRNTLLRAVLTGAGGAESLREYDELVAAWSLRPRLAVLLDRLDREPDAAPHTGPGAVLPDA